MDRIVLHLDMDSFFASVEIRQDPSLRGKPVVVGADPKGGTGRGVVSTASYEARKFGIRSGMPISRAYRLCPTAVFLPVRFPLYIQVSVRILEILDQYTDRLEPVSIDEAFLNMTPAGTYEAATEIAKRIKEEIRDREQLTCSIGIGPSHVVAKIASDFEKPDGLTVVRPDRVQAFLFPLPVAKLPGIGGKTATALSGLGIETIGQLARRDVQELRSLFGKWGITMHELALGRDIGNGRSEEHMRSIGRESTFEEDTADRGTLEETLRDLAIEAHQALREEGYRTRTLTIKVRDQSFTTRTRSFTFPHPTGDLALIQKQALVLLEEFLDGSRIRLLGIRFTNLAEDQSIQGTIDQFLEDRDR